MLISLDKPRVGVLRGGPSPEYEVSLDTGSTVLANLPEEYEPIDILISKDGGWYLQGIEKKPANILQHLDMAVNALHGTYGEDGTVQKMLEQFGVPYTGSESLPSAVGMNKALAKNIFKQHGLQTPYHLVVNQSDDLGQLVKKINESIPFPVIVKPTSSGSSLGVSYVAAVKELLPALEKAFALGPQVLVEEFIQGKQGTCGVIENFRGSSLYTLLPTEIMLEKNPVYTYELKYGDMGHGYRIPGNWGEREKADVEELARESHRALGLRHYSRTDFIIHPRRGVFILEVNTLPTLTHRSSFIKSLEAAGGTIKEFLAHLISRALRR